MSQLEYPQGSSPVSIFVYCIIINFQLLAPHQVSDNRVRISSLFNNVYGAQSKRTPLPTHPSHTHVIRSGESPKDSTLYRWNNRPCAGAKANLCLLTEGDRKMSLLEQKLLQPDPRQVHGRKGIQVAANYQLRQPTAWRRECTWNLNKIFATTKSSHQQRIWLPFIDYSLYSCLYVWLQAKVTSSSVLETDISANSERYTEISW